MALMLAKTYAAFKAVGVGEADAQAAAEELAEFEGRFVSLESRITSIEGKVTVLLWAVEVNAAVIIAILGVLLRHG